MIHSFLVCIIDIEFTHSKIPSVTCTTWYVLVNVSPVRHLVRAGSPVLAVGPIPVSLAVSHTHTHTWSGTAVLPLWEFHMTGIVLSLVSGVSHTE